MEDRDEERKIGHLKIPRRALGSCAVLQLSGLPLQEDALKLGNEIVIVLGTHSQEEDAGEETKDHKIPGEGEKLSYFHCCCYLLRIGV